jgi:hypothetical protein
MHACGHDDLQGGVLPQYRMGRVGTRLLWGFMCNHRRARRKTAVDQPGLQMTRIRLRTAAARPRFYNQLI